VAIPQEVISLNKDVHENLLENATQSFSFYGLKLNWSRVGWRYEEQCLFFNLVM
jgi:hypothetical protein